VLFVCRPTAPASSPLTGGHDSIVVIEFNDDSGSLRRVRVNPSLGKTPRDFVLAPDGRTVVVAHQHSNDITTYSYDPAGGAMNAIATVSVASPVCLQLA
jgi:6-phosphogluconolactonase